VVDTRECAATIEGQMIIIDEIINMSEAGSKRQVMSRIAPLQGLHEVMIKPVRGTRRQQANRFWWGVVVQSLYDFLRAQGQIVSREECHTMLKLRCAPKEIFDPRTGELIATVPSESRTMSIPEFSQMITMAKQYLEDMFGIVLPELDNFQEKP